MLDIESFHHICPLRLMGDSNMDVDNPLLHAPNGTSSPPLTRAHTTYTPLRTYILQHIGFQRHLHIRRADHPAQFSLSHVEDAVFVRSGLAS